MFCPKCGTENPDISSFCSKCGQAINGTVPPSIKKSRKVIWILGSILGLILVCCVAPTGYGYMKIKSISTFTPIPTVSPKRTHTPMPTDIAMPKNIVVNFVGSDCAPVYHSEYGSPVDCIPNGTILHVESNGPLESSRWLFWTIRWVVDGKLRVAGYIKRADVSPLYPGDPTPTFIPTGKWVTTFEKSSFDDTRTVILALKANSPVSGWVTDATIPLLIVRCKEKKTEAYVNVGMQQDVESGLYNQSTIRVRFDSQEAASLISDHSTDGKGLFFHDPQTIIDQMLQHEKMVFGFTPFNSNPVETSFDLRGLNEAIKPLQDSCK
jgi:hypothetical protein